MTKRIFRAICLVAVTAFLAAILVTVTVLYHNFSSNQKSQMKNQLQLAAQGVNLQGKDYFDGLAFDHCRITWIDAGGKVLYDSLTDPTGMSNHLEREEVNEALNLGYGESIRYSDTLLNRSFYTATRLDDGTVLRISVSQDRILVLIWEMLRPTVLILFVAALLSFVLASRLAKRIVEPLNALNLDEPLSNTEYDEITPLLGRIDSQQKKLRSQADELEKRQQEFHVITKNLSEGLILLNDKGVILSINPAAQKWVANDTDCVGQDIRIVHPNTQLDKLLNKAFAGKRREAFIELGEGYYQFDVSPIFSDGAVTGAMILMFDVTEKGQVEQLRREFTANVSHELKTPLHSISGYAELLTHGMVRQQDIPMFSGKIYSEAQRMIQLIEDIMKLSHLDESEDELQREPLELYQLTADTLQSFYDQAKKHNINLQLKGSPAMIRGIPRLISVIISNLCDNAIKYNHDGGNVTVLVYLEGKYAVLSVKDDGIGISPEYQERIFERFYRVDKSHSKEVGGTGLGLSIVKHAARLHHAKLDVESAIGQGTKITIRFPR